ncbi:hypothetical protein EI94DRAFT_1698513 [Lactarius quietus]|nr:hypothetical protein EI94DRAFT_1698513 [Lactarius quietus]
MARLGLGSSCPSLLSLAKYPERTFPPSPSPTLDHSLDQAYHKTDIPLLDADSGRQAPSMRHPRSLRLPLPTFLLRRRQHERQIDTYPCSSFAVHCFFPLPSLARRLRYQLGPICQDLEAASTFTLRRGGCAREKGEGGKDGAVAAHCYTTTIRRGSYRMQNIAIQTGVNGKKKRWRNGRADTLPGPDTHFAKN